ncbi:hypothetical protein H9661_12120 [Clostridium sp. Sa3CVN1]|uniref:Uncharacterized protein n=1 Tax=Clostridium cibarium TaxID=2762247 RepID=A0ABR8PV85_9CLOT|nr:hypothetical protein [Clostridium cibarium]
MISLWRIDTNKKEFMDKKRYLITNSESNEMSDFMSAGKGYDIFATVVLTTLIL